MGSGLKSLRRTGRTTRMFQVALEMIKGGNPVVVVVSKHIAWEKSIPAAKAAMEAGLVVYEPRSLHWADEDYFYIPGISKETEILVDHEVIEQRFSRAINMLHRFDAKPEAQEDKGPRAPAADVEPGDQVGVGGTVPPKLCLVPGCKIPAQEPVNVKTKSHLDGGWFVTTAEGLCPYHVNAIQHPDTVGEQWKEAIKALGLAPDLSPETSEHAAHKLRRVSRIPDDTLTLPEVEKRLSELEDRYGVSTEEFIRNPRVISPKRLQISEDDAFLWPALESHRRELTWRACGTLSDGTTILPPGWEARLTKVLYSHSGSIDKWPGIVAKMRLLLAEALVEPLPHREVRNESMFLVGVTKSGVARVLARSSSIAILRGDAETAYKKLDHGWHSFAIFEPGPTGPVVRSAMLAPKTAFDWLEFGPGGPG
jgi:hypothetical protein